MKIAKGSKLVMIGDSVTDASRVKPAGEGLFEAIGRGYVCYVDALLSARYPDYGIRVVNMGNSGNTVRDLKARWQTDVFNQKPNWLSIMIGINDVWRQFDVPRQKEAHVGPEEYEQTQDELLAQTKPTVPNIVLMTPYFIEPNPNDEMRKQMDRYGAIVKRLAAKHQTLFVDTQAAFNEVLGSVYSGSISWDRVHPNHIGHMALARAFLKTVEFEW